MITGDDRVLFERSLRHATETTSGEALDAALAELGWHDALADDPRTAVSSLFELQGRSAVTSSALDAVLAVALGIDAPGVAVVLPLLGLVAPPGGGRDAAGLATAAVDRAGAVVIGTADGIVLVDPKELAIRPIAGLDPAMGLVAVSIAGVGGTSQVGEWTDAVAAGQRALAHELVGASRAMLQLARDHALERVQFDRLIAGFQAVRHRLAEAYVAIEAADGAAGAAWDDGSALAAAAAKALAGRSARVVARHTQQVLAGNGFTAEHPLQRFVRRALVLDRLLGDSRSLTRAMGEELLRTRQLPPMLPL